MEVASTPEEAMKKATGRIVIVDTGDLTLYNKIKDNSNYKTISIEKFEAKYHNYTYNMVILEKNT